MTVSDSTKNDLIAWNIPKKNIKVIQNGVSISGMPKKLPTKEKKKTALYLGAISKDKGIFDAILAFNEINRKDDDWQFWVAGKSSEDMNDKIKNLINSLEIKNKIKLLGFVSDKKKFELFAKSHVLINPSVREGWGLVNIEANSVGTPVVGYKVPGMCDSVKDGNTGILVNFGDYRNLATSAIKLVGDKNLYPKFQVQCKKWAQKFSWEKSAKASLELIENI
jgi:glycosyltransferase involved in cell wall biosynthesis